MTRATFEVSKKESNKKNQDRLLTETELELMNILWKLGQGSVHEVMAALSQDRPLAYTSVSTMLRILEQKNFVGSQKEGRGHLYFPKIKKENYEKTSIQNLVEKVFDGTPSAMVKRLLENEGLSAEELKSIKELIEHSAQGAGGGSR